MHLFPKFIFGIKLYVLLCPSTGVLHSTYSNGICHTEWNPDPARKLTANLYDIYHCRVYSEKLLLTDRGTV